MGSDFFESSVWLIWLCIALTGVSCNSKDTLFTRLPSGQTGIDFSNDITEDKNFNIINYTNMYNGGGVAVADFNGDSLQDLYFTGNMVQNKLYLNQGDFNFKEVTKQANVAGAGRWSSGVAAVDINADGLMDLYVCATTYDDPERRTNLLYINQGVNKQGIPVFEEQAAAYNLADTTNTTMAAFFDYDNDNDLDLYLLVNKFTRNSSMDRYHDKMTHGEAVTTDRLYRNEGADSLGHPYFIDVSDQAGILMEGFGLGLNISDFNKDGWKDIYVSNDFVTNEVLYMNNGDGTFSDRAGEVFKHTVHASMGNDVADINNDAHPDVLMVDMLPPDNYRKKTMLQPGDYSAYIKNKRYGYDFQYVRNQLQLYQGDRPGTNIPLYSDVGIYAGISETDWSWSPLLADFDNDGLRDLIITNGFPKDVTDHDYENYVNQYHSYVSMEKLLEKMPSVKLSNHVFHNTGNARFEDVTKPWGMKIPSFSNGAVQADLDNDGDLDYVVNNINETPFVFRNRQQEKKSEGNHYLRIRLHGKEGNVMGLGATVTIKYGNGQEQYYDYTTYRGYLSSVEPVAHFGLGKYKRVDSLIVTWPDGSMEIQTNLKTNQELTVDIADATGKEMKTDQTKSEPKPLFTEANGELGIDFVHQELDFIDFNIQPLLPHKLSQYGPALAVGDANGDGWSDVYISGAFEKKGIFLIQQPDGTFQREDLLERDDPRHREEEQGALFFDADGDGDDDLYIVSGGYEQDYGDPAYQDRLFINEGGQLVLDEDALPNYFLASGSAVRAADFDRDGDLDLFVGGRVYPHEYPKPVDSYLLENVTEDEEVHFKNVNKQKAPALNDIGMVSDALWTDFNNDGWTDLILAGECMPLRFLENDSGTLVDVTANSGIADRKGWWNSLCSADFDNDGDTDYIAGNLGINTFHQASEQYPMRMYGNDFDKNGRYDALLSTYIPNRQGQPVEVPFHNRENVEKQLPPLRQMYNSYESFAMATMTDILSRFDTTGTLVEEATYMKSSYVENSGDGTFSISPLPYQAQWAPIYGCISDDVNGDGNQDLLLTGNDYGTEVRTGRYDALNGLMLTGRGNGTFEIHDFEDSGFFVPGDAKAAVSLLNARDQYIVLAAQNKGPLKSFTKGKVTRSIPLNPDDASAIIYHEDGGVQKREFYYGSGFLSQSQRYLIPPEQYSKIEITNFRGETRTIE